jgi:hypothetical protein
MLSFVLFLLAALMSAMVLENIENAIDKVLDKPSVLRYYANHDERQ